LPAQPGGNSRLCLHGERAVNWSGASWRRCRWRVARRGGNYNNTSNAGVGYMNGNNTRSNANGNNGARPRSRNVYITLMPDGLRIAGLCFCSGGVRFPPVHPVNNTPRCARKAARNRHEDA